MRTFITSLAVLDLAARRSGRVPAAAGRQRRDRRDDHDRGGTRRHAARHRAALWPRLRGNHQREPGHRPVAARRRHRGRRTEAAPAAARAAHRDRHQPAGAPPLLVSARHGGKAAGGADLPGQHREDGLEHAAGADGDRVQGQGCPVDSAEVGARGTREAWRDSSRRSCPAVRTTRWDATRWRLGFPVAPT